MLGSSGFATPSLLPTAQISLLRDNRRPLILRALIDSGSQVSFISAEAARHLHAPLLPGCVKVTGLGSGSGISCPGYLPALIDIPRSPPLKIRLFAIDSIAESLPSSPVDLTPWSHLRELPLADPLLSHPLPVELLLGVDVLSHIILPEIITSPDGGPLALNTVFGWCVMGHCLSPNTRRHISWAPEVQDNEGKTYRHPHRHGRRLISSRTSYDSQQHLRFKGPFDPSHPASCIESSPHSYDFTSSDLSIAPPLSASNLIRTFTAITNLQLHRDLQKFWELESVKVAPPSLSADEQRCEDFFVASVSRDSTGRYITPLPLVANELGESYYRALNQFRRLERRLQRDPTLKDAYDAFMREYLDLGHMIPAPPPHKTSAATYYLPHHPVHRAGDPPSKIRVVFNASSKSSNGKSLNDISLTGPKLQSDIVSIITRSRTHRFIFIADIKQMYRQILVPPEHQDLQRIIWRFSPDQPVTSYRLRTVTYGVSSSPYLAIRTLHQLARDEGSNYPLAASALLRDSYVDDIITGAATIADARRLRDQLIALLRAGGFELRKWAANSPLITQDLPSDHCRLDPQLLFAEPENNHTVKILGLVWSADRDSFSYRVDSEQIPATKRLILSKLARIYDPPGWLTPITFTAKLFVQKLWAGHLDWDEPAPEEINREWDAFQTQLNHVEGLSIPRYFNFFHESRSRHRLIGFCDASEQGYAAVLYLQSTASSGEISVSLLLAKSRVAPLKKVSLPRLELCGAHLLASLVSRACQMFEQTFEDITAFSDSAVALAWIRGEPRRWKEFVANRVAEIQDSIPPAHWRHINGRDNPADCASRGLFPAALPCHPLWWKGPPWLAHPSNQWPSTRMDSPTSAVDAERRPSPKVIVCVAVTELNLESRYSSLIRLQRIASWCLRFSRNCRNPPQRLTGPLSAQELRSALNRLVKEIQRTALSEEYAAASNPNSPSRLKRTLQLFIDPEGILRVGGRLSLSPKPFATKHPAVLPKNHPFTNLVIDSAHITNLHSGPSATHSYIRQLFWIIDGKNIVRRRLRSCNRCFSVNPQPLIPTMGLLPKDRVSPTFTFSKVGVDYAGPYSVSTARFRGCRVAKAYICAFVCFATKAVHLELASELSVPAFLAALARFCGRRGLPSDIYSDNGTNFVGASRHLNELGRFLQNADTRDAILHQSTGQGIQWHFIPPGAPHFGGLWEAAIKSTKRHLRKVMGTQILSFEEFSTLLIKVEATLNSRPICPLSSDPQDLEALTPGHFLIHRPLNAPPTEDLTDRSPNHLSCWKSIDRLHQSFWRRWSTEYLHTLQQRSKWTESSPEISIGTLVLIKQDNLPPLRWPRGRVTELHPGPDGRARVATLITSSGPLRRPFTKLCPLPTQ